MSDPFEDLVKALGPPPKRRDTTAKLAITMQSPMGFHEQEQQLRLPTTIQIAIVRPGNETEIIVVTVDETANYVKRVEVVTVGGGSP